MTAFLGYPALRRNIFTLVLPTISGLALLLSGCASPLHDAIREGNTAEMQKQLSAGAEINDPENPPLVAAAGRGNLEMVRILLDHGAKADLREPQTGNTAFIQAAAAGDLNIMQLLLARGAVIDARNAAGNTALMEAAANNHRPAVEFLLGKGKDVNAANTEGWPPLFFAVRYGHYDTARLLLDKGADVNARNNLGFSALIIASAYGHTPIVTMLLDRGADIDAIDTKWKQTSLHWATVNNHIDTVQILLQRGIDTTPRNYKKFTALQGAEIYERHEIGRLIAANPPAYRQQMLAAKARDYRVKTAKSLKSLPLEELLARNELDNPLFVPLLNSFLELARETQLPEYLRRADEQQVIALLTIIDMQLVQAQDLIAKYQSTPATNPQAIADLQAYCGILKTFQAKIEPVKERFAQKP